MPVTHEGCGGAVRWKSVVDDDGVPAMIPWCQTCNRAMGPEDMTAGPEDMDRPDPDELSDHLFLRQLARVWVRPNGTVH